MLKQFAHCYREKLTNTVNDCLKESRFPNLMKVTEIRPVFKKVDNTSEDNHRPISTLSNFAKLFESIIYLQLDDYIENRLSKYLTGFHQNHKTQNSLLRTIKLWKAKLNNGSKVGVT